MASYDTHIISAVPSVGVSAAPKYTGGHFLRRSRFPSDLGGPLTRRSRCPKRPWRSPYPAVPLPANPLTVPSPGGLLMHYNPMGSCGPA